MSVEHKDRPSPAMRKAPVNNYYEDEENVLLIQVSVLPST